MSSSAIRPSSLRSLSTPLLRALLGAALLGACGEDPPATTDGDSTSSGSTGSTSSSSDPTTPTTTTVDPTTGSTTDPTTTTVDPTTTTVDPTTGTTIEPSTGDTTTTTVGTDATGDTDTTASTTIDQTTGSTTEGPACGNGVLDDGEVCDDGNNDGSYNGCNADCLSVGPFCGDGELNGPELCDDANDNNEDECTVVCAPPACGDNLVQANEECDGENLGGADCIALGFAGGILACVPDLCTFETSACLNAGDCGNGVINEPEVCDGADVNGQTCADVDPNVFAGGELVCAPTCDAIDSAQCDSGNCCLTGDAGACDVTAIRDCVCANDDFCCDTAWDGICVSEAADCGAVCPCGDGVIGPGEVCDGEELGGESCMTQGFDSGTLVCNDTCDAFVTDSCGASCCVPGDPGACDQPDVLNCVCDQDSFCCDTAWDDICVDEALSCGAQC